MPDPIQEATDLVPGTLPNISFTDDEWAAIIQEIFGDTSLTDLSGLYLPTKNGLVSALVLLDYINNKRLEFNKQLWDSVKIELASHPEYKENISKIPNLRAEVAKAKSKLSQQLLGEVTKSRVVEYDPQGNPVSIYDLPGELPIKPSPDRPRLKRYLGELSAEVQTKIARSLNVSSLDYLTPEQETKAAALARTYSVKSLASNVRTESGRRKLQEFLQDEDLDLKEQVEAGRITQETADVFRTQLQQQTYGKGSEWEKWQWEQTGTPARRITEAAPQESSAQDWFASQMARAGAETPIAEAVKKYVATGETSGYPESFLGQMKEAVAKATPKQREINQLATARRFIAQHPELAARFREQVAREWGSGSQAGGYVRQALSPETGGRDVETGGSAGAQMVSGGSYIPEYFYELRTYGAAMEDPEVAKMLREEERKTAEERPAAYEAYQNYLEQNPTYTGSLEGWLGSVATPLQTGYIKRQEEELTRQRRSRERAGEATSAPSARWLSW